MPTQFSKNVRIVLILPSLTSGGLERVITELAWYFSKQNSISVCLISLAKGDFFFPLPDGIQIIMPTFQLKSTCRPIYLIRLIFWLRAQIKGVNPEVLLSFGGKFNSFVLLSVLGINIRTFISDRSQPTISYGSFLNWLNPLMYRKATGIIAQTNKAKEYIEKKIKHKNIKVIGNPINVQNPDFSPKENIILNVGRFIQSKQQDLLLSYFHALHPKGWKLVFLGDGYKLTEVKRKAKAYGLEEKVEFHGAVKDVTSYLIKVRIFAFTSNSEGFPNALGEAMAAGLACISFNCEAGPSDLIDDEINGFLINENDHVSYISKLKLLIENNDLRNKFGNNAIEKVKKFSIDNIGQQYLNFITQSENEVTN
jgi:GalNAc-alpha-(1->4)-GalNAc-alpha-(1->3)-diNAcBac-PP-undecaprenol alpha-1,4-N-acetyl-D-galactosaminyltransferase